MRQYFGIIVLIVIAGIGFFLYLTQSPAGRKNSFFTFDSGVSGVRAVQEKLASTTASAGRLLADHASSTLQRVVEGIDGAVGTMVGDAQTAATNAIKNTIAQKLTQIAAGIGASPATGTGASGADPNSVSVAVRSGAAVSFTIKNAESGAVAFTIDWRDGHTETGSIPAGRSQTVSHAWSVPGEYQIMFTLKSAAGIKENIVTISIL